MDKQAFKGLKTKYLVIAGILGVAAGYFIKVEAGLVALWPLLLLFIVIFIIAIGKIRRK